MGKRRMAVREDEGGGGWGRGGCGEGGLGNGGWGEGGWHGRSKQVGYAQN